MENLETNIECGQYEEPCLPDDREHDRDGNGGTNYEDLPHSSGPSGIFQGVPSNLVGYDAEFLDLPDPPQNPDPGPSEEFQENQENQTSDIPDLPDYPSPGPSGVENVDLHDDIFIALDSHLDEEKSEGSTDTYTSDHEEDHNMDPEQIHLPSETFQPMRSLNPDNPLRKSARKTLRSRKSQKRDGLDTIDGAGTTAEDVALKAILSGHTHESGGALEMMQKRDAIKELPTSMHRKRSMWDTLNIPEQEHHGINCWQGFKLQTAMRWQHFKVNVKNTLSSIDLWRGHLKQVQGSFGTGVLSYFIFLRWLFLLNVVIVTLTTFFLFIPQMVYDASYKSNNASFEGWELLTGKGWLSTTELYYGVYTNASIPTSVGSYSMSAAYLFVGAGYLLLCLIILVTSMAVSYRENYIDGGEEFSLYTAKIFAAWDHGITDKSAGLLKHKSIFNEFKESLTYHKKHNHDSFGDKCVLIFVRVLTNFAVLAFTSGAIYLIWYVATHVSNKAESSVLQQLMLPFTVSALNLLLPFMFRMVASLEQYKNPRTTVNVSLTRIVILKLASLVAVVVFLFQDVHECRQDKTKTCQNCWESYIGQTFYRLIIMDFIFILFSSLFGEFIRKLLAVHCGHGRVGVPGFDISRNVLDLVFAQALAWIGIYFGPLLSFVNLLKFLILFYVKKVSLMNNCRPSMRPFKAAKMNLVFLAILGISYVIVLATIGFTITEQGKMTPSAECGPFRGTDYVYQVVEEIIKNKLPAVLRTFVQYISSPTVIILLLFLVGLAVLYFRMLKKSNEKKIKLMKNQLSLAGRDKLFLMKIIKKGILPGDPRYSALRTQDR